ncbi:MAG: hypothetical protein PHP23_13845, partial [Desulfobacterales bacterium]|nr:hypothetical protein [Desulfobacterales bacterium]
AVAEALTEGSAGGLLSSGNHQFSGADHVVRWGRQHVLWRYNASHRTARRSLRTWHVWTSFTRESGDP